MSENPKRTLTILYGSQTGNAQDVSERIWRESKRYHFTGCVKPMDEYKITDLIHESCVIFVCSTTGQGEEPDNMKKFWKFLLRKNLLSDSLIHIKCAVLGLGDSSYVKFNFVAKRLNKRLANLGANLILPLALGDDQHDLGYDAVVDVWIESLWKTLLDIFPLPKTQVILNDTTIKPRWKVDQTKRNEDSLENSSIYFNDKIKIPNNQFWVEIIENSRTTSVTHFQDVRLIKFRTTGQEYEPGDVLYVRPKNSSEQIEQFQNVLKSNGIHFEPDSILKLTEYDSDMPVPLHLRSGVTFRKLCEEYFDLNAIPRRYVFHVLAQLTSSDLEREKCLEFTTAEGQEELYNYCNRPRRNVMEVLQDFPHAIENLTLDMLFELLPAIKSRAFSIASSCKAHSNEIHILVAVVKYRTKLVKERLGLCSNWLANLEVGDKIPVWLKRGSFQFPKNKEAAIIMIGPGTGVAPFRNYIYEAEHLSNANSKHLILIFGCRNKNHDFHFQDDFKRLQTEDKLQLICAFSRDQTDKIYVQHKIEEHGEQLCSLLSKRNTFIFVAGNSKNMPQAVRDAFVNICKRFGGVNFRDEDAAENFISLLERNGQYQTETWS